MCNSAEETSSHIFLQCKVSIKAWQIILPQNFGLRFPEKAMQLFKDWSKQFPGSLRNKPILNRLWTSIPKNLCWQLWLARNRAIFKEQKVTPIYIATKAIGMIAEKFNTDKIFFPLLESIPEPLSSWCKLFLKEDSSLQPKIGHKLHS